MIQVKNIFRFLSLIFNYAISIISFIFIWRKTIVFFVIVFLLLLFLLLLLLLQLMSLLILLESLSEISEIWLEVLHF